MSLSERLAEAEQAVRPQWCAETIHSLYDTLFSEIFGMRSPRHSLADNASIGRMLSLCIKHDVDPPVFIAANMLVLQPWLAKQRRLTFRPTMLATPKAVERYNDYIRKANRRYRRGLTDVFGSRQWLESLRQEAVAAEEAIGDYFLRANLSGDTVSLKDAVETVKPEGVWSEFARGNGINVSAIASLYGAKRLVQECDLILLRAVWSVCERLRHGLSDRVAFRALSWEALLRALRPEFAEPRVSKLPRLSVRAASAMRRDGTAVWGRV